MLGLSASAGNHADYEDWGEDVDPGVRSVDARGLMRSTGSAQEANLSEDGSLAR